jgi:hypothetical protein
LQWSECMPTNELENLVRSIVDGLSAQAIRLGTDSITAPPGGGTTAEQKSAGEQAIERVLRPISGQLIPLRETTSDAGRLAAEIEQLRRAVAEPAATFQQTTSSASRSTEPDNGSSTAETVLKTVGMITGVGPIATGLMALFGSRRSETTIEPALYEAPQSINLESGLTADRGFTAISFAADGTPRQASRSNVAASTPPIQINVQAMDSRSFLDHSDEIARAVRDAMLHSHGLNDVVSEL